MNPPRRKGSLGCFGVFCIFLLLIFTAINALSLGKLNPFWYDRLAFWKGPLLEPQSTFEVAPVASAQTIAANKDDQRVLAAAWEESQRAKPPTPTEFKIAPAASITANLSPSRQATLDGGDGFVLNVPAGAVAQDVQATVTPVIELPDVMAGPICGPVWNVAIGPGRPGEHYRFASPVTMSLACVRNPVSTTPPSLAFWNGKDWETVPSRFDPKTGKVSADVTHASIWTVVGAGARVAGPYALAAYVMVQGVNGSAVRGGSWLWQQWGASCLRTDNFCVYYFLRGDSAVQVDTMYAGRGTRLPNSGPPAALRRQGNPNPDPNAVPLFVQDVAAFAEEGRVAIEATGIKLPAVGVTEARYNIFIGKLGALGETKPGGHVFLSGSAGDDFSGAGLDVQRLLRCTVIHELLHTAQGNYFGTTGMTIQSWRPANDDRNAPAEPLIEGTAAYLADRICRDIGQPANMTRDFYLLDDKGRLLTQPIDRLGANRHYAWFRFLDWVDDKYGNIGRDIALDFFNNGTLTLDAFDQSVRRTFSTKRSDNATLATVYREFANEFTCTGVIDSKLAPKIHKRTMQQQADLQTSALQFSRSSSPVARAEWMHLATRTGTDQKNPTVVLNVWDIVSLYRINHLSSHAFYVEVPAEIHSRTPKVVIDLKLPRGASPKALVGDWHTQVLPPGAAMPQGCSNVESKAVERKDRHLTACIPLKDRRITRAAMIAHNLSLSEDISDVDVQRYLLLAPAWCEFSRDGEGDTLEARRWTIKWHRNELDSFPDVFEGYCVYRKLAGEDDKQFVLVAEGIKDCVYTDHVHDLKKYAYTVRVRDQRGNESENAQSSPDPFVGKWSGEIQLVKGSLIEDLIREIERAGSELDAKEQASINQMNPQDQAAAREAWQKQKDAAAGFFGPVKTMLLNAEGILKLGVPVEFQIRSDNGEYKLMLTEVAYKPMGMTVEHEIAMLRTGRDSLRMKIEATTDDEFWSTLKEMGVKSPELVLTRAPPTASQSSVRNSNKPGQNWVIPSMADGRFRGAELKWWFDRTDATPPAPVKHATEGFMVELNKESGTRP